MNAIARIGRILAAVLLFALFASDVSAQATRTWVSGVGDDANPCSRTAPCKTFAGAISKTAAGGVINALDPGGFGAVTITKSITIENIGEIAGVLAAGTNGVIVNAAATDVVILRGLSFDGVGSGLNGVRFLAGGKLVVEDSTIRGFIQQGIDFEPSGASKLLVRNTTITKCTGGAGIFVQPTGAGTAAVTIENSQLFGNKSGIIVQSGVATIKNSMISQSDQNGIFANSSGAVVNVSVDDSLVANSTGVGIRSSGANASVFVSRTSITGNGTGVAAVSSGALSSYKNNRLIGNGTPGTFTALLTED